MSSYLFAFEPKPDHDSSFTIAEVNEGEKTVLLKWKQNGVQMQCWVPMDECEIAVKH